MPPQALTVNTFTKDGLLYVLRRDEDPDEDLSFLQDPTRHAGIPEPDASRYQEEDRQRVAAYHRGEWTFVGVTCEIRIADGGPRVARASMWGIESDSSPAYFADVEREVIAEAEAEVARVRRALCG